MYGQNGCPQLLGWLVMQADERLRSLIFMTPACAKRVISAMHIVAKQL